jgi:hypothetical protein
LIWYVAYDYYCIFHEINDDLKEGSGFETGIEKRHKAGRKGKNEAYVKTVITFDKVLKNVIFLLVIHQYNVGWRMELFKTSYNR